jgi:hypothetical protein
VNRNGRAARLWPRRQASLPNSTIKKTGIPMTNMKPARNNLIGVAALGLLTLVPITQYAADMGASTPAQDIPFSIGAEGGTTGLGGNLGWRFADHFGVESGFDYFDYSYHGKIKDNEYNAGLRLMSVPLNLELFPWARSSLHLSLGMLFNENRLSGTASSTTLKLNHDTYSGSLNLLYKPETVDPYVGFGANLYFDKAHHWSLMGALGVAYAGDGTVSLTGTSTTPGPVFQTDLQAEKSKVQSYARDLKFWPVIKIGLTYSF